MTIKVHCAKCGCEFDLDDKWKGFAEKFPERLTCMSCKNEAKENVSTAYKNTEKPASYTKKANSYKSSNLSSSNEVDAAMFRKAYDELTAEFSDVLDDVKEYLGGWTSTIVINRSRK